MADEILTASLPAGDETVSAIVSGAKAVSSDIPPSGVGSLDLRKAAAAGNATAQFVVASRFMDGERVTRDFSQAAFWYGRAAAAGLAPAQYRMGTLFERGKGVDQDLKQALSWYERAAALGHVRAMHNAAVILAGTGLGEPDYARAFKWFTLAANHGLKDSAFNLAILLERGLGTKPKPAEALFWYLAAAKQNDVDAQKRADALASTLKPSKVGQIMVEIKNWTPEKAPESANAVAVDQAAWQDKNG
jgi:localization factor PodJL